MSEEKDKRRPAHEVVLDKLEAYLGPESPESAPYAIAAVERALCDVLREMHIPEKHLGEVIGRLKKLNELPDLESITEAVRDLEARQPAEQPPEGQPAAVPSEPAPAVEPAPGSAPTPEEEPEAESPQGPESPEHT